MILRNIVRELLQNALDNGDDIFSYEAEDIVYDLFAYADLPEDATEKEVLAIVTMLQNYYKEHYILPYSKEMRLDYETF